jgi:diguanylate cyclase (GGDEF)-like protein
MKHIRIIDTETNRCRMVLDRISHRITGEVHCFQSVAQARSFSADLSDCTALILDIHASPDDYSPLPGVPVILVNHGVPINTRALLLASCVLDYVQDYSGHNCAYIVHLLEQIPYRQTVSVALIHRDPAMAHLICRRLDSLGVKNHAVTRIQNAVQRIDEDMVHFVFLDAAYGERGLTLLSELRKKYNKRELYVMVLMDEPRDHEVDLEYLYAGANWCVEKSISAPAALEYFTLLVNNALQQVISYLEMQYMAKRDSLTGAVNRRYFMEMGASLFSNYRRGNLQIAVAMVDIDDFKHINDTYGHPVGDRVIIHLYESLSSRLRKNDIVARFGGEEFCILLTGSDMEAAPRILERIRSIIADTHVWYEDDASVKYTVSMGLCMHPLESLEDMIIAADRYLYQAKERGKNRLIS